MLIIVILLKWKIIVKGGNGPIIFTDVSKKNAINLGFSSFGPSYRKAGKGINIFGICKCQLLKQMEKK